MKTLIILGTVALAIGLIAAGALAGAAWARDRWERNAVGYGAPGLGTMGPGMMGGGAAARGYDSWGPGMMGGGAAACGYDSRGPGMMGGGAAACGLDSRGPGMMGGGPDWGEMPCGGAYTAPGTGAITSLEEAETVVRDYVERLGYTGLEVTEVMEFERNYYAIVAEQDSGIGAMELLVDKDSGAAGPEPGPNMMWNAEYGMMGRGRGMGGMMGGYASGEMTLSPQEAEDAAQRWLDANLPGRTAGEADEFYGYYTFHFLRDGQIEGMLSVHGNSGDVWYHSWHGDFLAMTEDHS